MEIPAPLKQRLGTEELESAVNLGDEDIICFTQTRTLLYRGEGLISDDSVEVYEHNVDRLDVSEGRRKTAFRLTYVDDEKKFAVANSRADAVLERLLAGILTTADVIEDDEEIEGVFRFSEMALVITDKRIVKRVGAYLWEDDYEEYPYSNVTDLEFEEGSVATAIVISVDGRPQRIKAPRGDARLVRRTLTNALCTYYEVDSLDHLKETIGETEPPTDTNDDSSISSNLALDDSISPLVTPDDDDADVETLTTPDDAGGNPPTAPPEQNLEEYETGDTEHETEETTPEQERTQSTQETSQESASPESTEAAIDPEDIEGMKARLATLTKVAKRQNKLLKQQQQTINQLVEELQQQD
jgi:hypothetical protein